MRILIIRTYPNIMNIKNYNSQEIGLASAYRRAGHICDIVYFAGNTKSRVETVPSSGGDIKIYWLRSFSVFNNGFFFGLRKIIKNYDLLQVSEYDQITSWMLYTFSQKPVYIYHGIYDSDISKKHILKCKIVDTLLLHKRNTAGTKVFTKSELAAESVKKRGFKDVITVGVGLDLNRFGDEETESEFYKKLKAEKERENLKYLLYIGVLEDRRNIKFLFKCFSEVLKRNSDVRLVMIGRGEPEYCKECFDYADELSITDKIIYKEALPQNELKGIYSICNIFLLPTKYEIFGMVLLETMAFGLPVVTSENGGSSTLIIDGNYGTIVDKFESDLWCDAVCRYLDDSAFSKLTALNSSKLISEHFTWDSIANKILNEYSDIAGDK